MRIFVFALLIAGLAAPALAQDPSWQRRRNEAALSQETDRLRAAQYEREARARQQQARTEATLRAIRAGELAGGPSVAFSPYRPSDIDPLPPRPAAGPTPQLTGDAARMDDLMAAAMARSTARVKAMTGARPR